MFDLIEDLPLSKHEAEVRYLKILRIYELNTLAQKYSDYTEKMWFELMKEWSVAERTKLLNYLTLDPEAMHRLFIDLYDPKFGFDDNRSVMRRRIAIVLLQKNRERVKKALNFDYPDNKRQRRLEKIARES